ncbi:D-alanyl-D-alanine carboxypeptidase family protein [Falsibacillus albus]|uniref:D-alanyl-D-alanine carboxypeptidase family protein n=1 Tax=Falsibacillus albus TaxID=2478915 RepID=A0A3L7JWI1_9BACI|nr:D-alanyl-D-alanine carboxypeptidase family protein [Falsibacillus albus]RLQ95207.1 D-alanyl-D-alanine carboxypeptidase family protein [Falsibacillus albus]
MKRFLIVASAVVLLSGCSIPFIDKMKIDDSTEHKDSAPAENGENQNQSNQQADESSGGQSNGESGPTLQAAYFNQIKEVNGQKVIQNPSNILALVNKEFALPSTYAPADLVRPKVAFAFGDQDIEKSYMREEAASALEKMFGAAKNDGIILYAASGYRSYQRQSALLQAEIKNVGKEKAVQAVATPGQSEHQSGLAMDITSKQEKFLLTEHFEQTKEGIWLHDHAHEYGFILRYPKGKEGITGYEYEPWHFRYVGVKAAKEIFEHDWTLEEYFQQVKKV